MLSYCFLLYHLNCQTASCLLGGLSPPFHKGNGGGRCLFTEPRPDLPELTVRLDSSDLLRLSLADCHWAMPREQTRCKTLTSLAQTYLPCV